MFALKLNKTDTFWRTTVNYSTKFEDFANMCVFPNFYPNLPIFLHVTLRNSVYILQVPISQNQLKNKIYLIKFGHTSAILKKKSV